MIAIDFAQTNTEEFLLEIYPNIWLMDNHKWAYLVWYTSQRLKGSVPHVLVHLDYHWDGVNDFYHNEGGLKKLNKANSPEALRIIIKENKLIKADSFIAPAVIKDLIKEIHFFCFQEHDCQGLCETILKNYKINQYIHKDLDSLLESTKNKRVILDLDLDIFNKSENIFVPDIWKKDEIENFLYKIAKIIKNASVITIAISSVYAGYSVGDAEKLVKTVMPILEKYNN